jgi:hypothetical protein
MVRCSRIIAHEKGPRPLRPEPGAFARRVITRSELPRGLICSARPVPPPRRCVSGETGESFGSARQHGVQSIVR